MEQRDGSPPRLLDCVRDRLRLLHRSPRTERSYVDRVRLVSEAVAGFLTHLAVEENVPASTQNQALNALGRMLCARGSSATPLAPKDPGSEAP